MTETKLKITVEELADFIQERAAKQGFSVEFSVRMAQARRMLAADALYDALRRETDVLEYLDNPAAQVGRTALALADGLMEGGK